MHIHLYADTLCDAYATGLEKHGNCIVYQESWSRITKPGYIAYSIFHRRTNRGSKHYSWTRGNRIVAELKLLARHTEKHQDCLGHWSRQSPGEAVYRRDGQAAGTEQIAVSKQQLQQFHCAPAGKAWPEKAKRTCGRGVCARESSRAERTCYDGRCDQQIQQSHHPAKEARRFTSDAIRYGA